MSVMRFLFVGDVVPVHCELFLTAFEAYPSLSSFYNLCNIDIIVHGSSRESHIQSYIPDDSKHDVAVAII